MMALRYGFRKYIIALEKEGWLRHQPLEQAQTGWSLSEVFRTDHPGAAAAAPPLLSEEGHLLPSGKRLFRI